MMQKKNGAMLPDSGNRIEIEGPHAYYRFYLKEQTGLASMFMQ